jgi:DNA-binding winged helix-turn-helix (wHTH) protein
VPRYRFSEFVLSPRRRLLAQGTRELPLIPRYFDLLLFLVEHRDQAAHRRDIFERVWSDVIVSDSALSQAIRTIRRTLGDDSREPRFIRTVSRHGYQFVFAGVVEEDDDGTWPPMATPTPEPPTQVEAIADPFEPLLMRVARPPRDADDEEEQREAAEVLHSLGTSEALARLGTRPGHVYARALLRDARWESPTAREVPLLAGPAPFAVGRTLIALRLRRAARAASGRWAGAALGAGVAGVVGGALGGLILAAAPDSTAPLAVVPVLAMIGGACGTAGGAGVGAGLSITEAVARSGRSFALACGGAAGGAFAGSVAQWLSRWSLAALFGVKLDVGGGLEGVVIGAAAGLGYALATARARGALAAPRGGRRLRAAALVAGGCAVGALALSVAGRPLVGGTVHAIARATQGAQVTLAPLGRLIGEPGFGPVTQALIAAGEGALFGFGVAVGLTRRPRGRRP